MHADEHVLEGAHVGEEPDVLEGPTDARVDHVVRSRAPEDADRPDEASVPDGPDDRRQEHDDEAEDRGQGSQGRQLIGRRRGADQGGQQAEDHGRQDPDDRLEPGPDRVTDHPPPGDRDETGRWIEDADDDVEERRLSGAVGTDDADDRAARDLEVHLANRDQATERLRDPVRAKDGVDLARRRRHGGHQFPDLRLAVARPCPRPEPRAAPGDASTFGKSPSGLSSIIRTRARP